MKSTLERVMKPMRPKIWNYWIPALTAVVALGILALWLTWEPPLNLSPRVPGTDRGPEASSGAGEGNPVLKGVLTRSEGRPSQLPGVWPGFRGPGRDGILHQSDPLASAWDASGPRQLWSIGVGEGYAGPAVLEGRVYLLDYDRDKREDALRCLSLEDGREIWRFAYPVTVKRNHGMSRTVPAVTKEQVVGLGPKCHVVCLDAVSGELRWGLDLVRQFGTTVPPWYAGQCPLIENGLVILAPGGPQALLVAVDGATGKVVWRTPNPHGWKMTHSSIVPMEFAGRRFYVYCANQGVVGVSARDGALLWETTDWKISIATIPSPVVLDNGRIFLSGGYDAGSLMLQLGEEGGRLTAQTLFRLEPGVFGATQQTPVYFQNHLYGVRPDGQLVCLDLNGQVLWSSGSGVRFGMGPFLVADGKILVLNDSGHLSLIEGSPAQFRSLAEADVLDGHDCWGPMALAGGRLLVRDLTRLVCLEVGAPRTLSAAAR
jgi:outer membrane protein assembly factor BamB